MLRSRSSYAADKDALDRGAYGSKTWDTVSTACPTQRIVDASNRIEAHRGKYPLCGVYGASLLPPLPILRTRFLNVERETYFRRI